MGFSKSKLKILFVIPTLEIGGAERLIINICKEFNNIQNIDYRLVLMYDIIDFIDLSSDLKIVHCNSRIEHSILRKTIVNIDDFNNILNDFDPDIIHSNLIESEFLSHWFRFNNSKYFTHCHSNILLYKNFSFRVLFNRNLLVLFLKKITLIKKYKETNNHFVAISKDSERFLLKNLPSVFSDNIHFLPNAINFSSFFNPKRKLFATGIIKLVNIGHLNENKNQSLLILTIDLLIRKGIDCELHLIGDGVSRKKLEALVKSLNLNHFVFFHGKVQNIENYLWNMNIYVHSSLSEAFGLTMIEAMAAGLPVVCLDGKGNRDIIEDGKNGFMIYENSPEIFAAKIIELIQNKELYESMSKYAIEFAKKYDIKEYVDKLLKIYNEA